MREPLSPIWALEAPSSRRAPTGPEKANGVECGPADHLVFNEVFSRVFETAAEVAAVIADQGLAWSSSDQTQLLQAIEKKFLITEDTNIYVTGVGENTLQNALSTLNGKIIRSPAFVRIYLGAGDHIVDPIRGAILLNNRDGAQIKIIGVTPSGFPVESDIVADPIITENTLRSIFPTRIVVSGAVRAGLFMTGGTLSSLENCLFIGDKTIGQHGFLVGDWVNEIGTGQVRIVKCWFHYFGVDGLRVNYNSAVQCNQIGSTHNAICGIRSANQSGIQSLGSTISMYNTVHGALITDNGFFEIFSGTGSFRFNGGAGVYVDCGSNFQTGGAGRVKITSNSNCGVIVSDGASAYLGSPDFGESTYNAPVDVLVQIGSVAHVAGLYSGSRGMISSPAPNSGGNMNSYLFQH